MGQILTNKYNLPETLVKASMHDSHKVAGDISVTQLIDAPKIRILKRDNNYEVDVADNIYALMGTALHHILERANIDNYRKDAFILTAETIMKEADKLSDSSPEAAANMRSGANWIFSLVPVFFPEIGDRYIFEVTLKYVDKVTGKGLYGTFDIFDKETGILYDYKFCSVYNYIFEEARNKWIRQTNVYAHMLRSNGYVVMGIRIVAFFRDWSEHALNRNNRDYPLRHIMEVKIPVHDEAEVSKYISSRLQLHDRAEKGEVFDCTGDERWASGDIWAVMQAGSKRAKVKFDIEEMAHTYIEENRHSLKKPWIQYRPGVSRKCERFCPVASFCDQRKKELEKIKEYNED